MKSPASPRMHMADAFESDIAASDLGTREAIEIVRAVYRREVAGETTTLRDLHKITTLSQAAALKAVARLEADAAVEIVHELYDPLESRIVLSRELRETLATGQGRKSA